MRKIRKADDVISRLFLPQKKFSNVVYVPSQYALSFEHEGKSYVFHTLTKQCVEAELPEKAYAGECFDALIEAMFMVPEDKDECAYYEMVFSILRTYSKKNYVSSYTIMPTLGCNARCIYCYEEGRKQVTMTREIVDATLQYIQNSCDGNEVKLSWFGGEPLLCPETIDCICDGLREKGIGFRSSMITNGSLITSSIVDKMIHRWNLKKVQVSMDGAEEDYISRKRYYHDPGAYDSVIHSIDRMSEAGIRVAIRCNLDEGNLSGVPQFIDDLSRMITCKQNVFVYFSPLMDVRAGENDYEFWEKIIKYCSLIVDAGFKPASFLEPSMKFRVNRCMADGGGVVIAPDGSLYPCEHCPAESRFGDVIHGITDEAARQSFCRTDLIREICRKCPFLPDCTGFSSCPCKDAHCRQVRELITKNALIRLVEQSASEVSTDEEDMTC